MIRDQKLLIDNIRVEKSDLGNYFTKLYYEMKNCEDKETITDEGKDVKVYNLFRSIDAIVK